MSDGVAVLVPLLSPNEPEATVTSIEVANGDRVEAGDVVAVVENTKSTEEVPASASGWIAGLTATAGTAVEAGDVLCWIGPDAAWTPPVASTDDRGDDVPAGLRISRPALALAQELGVDLAQLPVGPLVTTDAVRAAAGAGTPPPDAGPVDATKVVVFGGGGHGRTLVELVRAAGTYDVVGVVDDGLAVGTLVASAAVVGGRDALARLRSEGIGLAVNGVGGISRPADRRNAFDVLTAAGYRCPAVVHPGAVLEPTATVSDGAQVLARAYVGTDAVVGFGCLLNTAVVISHDCHLADHVNVSPGALLAGGVTVGEQALIGMGVTVNIGVRIGARARIGNSAVIKSDVPDDAIVRAGASWPG